MGDVVVRYAVYIAFFIIVVAGAYAFGYSSGKSNTTIQYITKEKEVIRYEAKEAAKIHAQPNLGRDSLLELMRIGKL